MVESSAVPSLLPLIPFLLVAVMGFGTGIFMIVGALSMMKLKSHGLAVIASILAMLACGPAWLIGLPLGIWSLFVLNRREVKAAFQAQARSRAAARIMASPESVKDTDSRPPSPVVHPMFVAVFWFGWTILVVSLALVALDRLHVVPPSVAMLFRPPFIMLVTIGSLALVLMVIAQAIKKRDWRATALGPRPGGAALGAAVILFVAIGIGFVPEMQRLRNLFTPRSDATAQLTFKVAGRHVEVTLNGKKMPVPVNGVVAMDLLPGEYEVVTVKNGQPAVRSGEVLIRGEKKTVSDSQADAIRITGPLTLAYGPGSSSPNVADFSAIQGRWTIVSQVKGGEAITEHQRGEWIEFANDMMRSDIPETPRYQAFFAESRFAMNSAAEPRQFDVLVIGAKGIYRLERDTLTLAIADAGNPRPTEFVSPSGSFITLTICRRAVEKTEHLSSAGGIQWRTLGEKEKAESDFKESAPE